MNDRNGYYYRFFFLRKNGNRHKKYTVFSSVLCYNVDIHRQQGDEDTWVTKHS